MKRKLILFAIASMLLAGGGCSTSRAPSGPPEFVRVNSYLFDAVRYNPNSLDLDIELNNGVIMRYKEVPEQFASRLLVIGGKAGYFKDNIMGCFPSETLYQPGQEEVGGQQGGLVGASAGLYRETRPIHHPGSVR